MKDILAKVKEDKVKFIELWFPDIFGVLKSIEIPATHLADAIEGGVWFDGSSIKGFARIMESDMYLKPDLDTYAVLPGEEDKRTARFFCDVYSPDGTLFPGSPRALLKRVMAEAKAKGYEFKVGPEVEFYLFRRLPDGSITTPEFDTGSYFDSPVGDIGAVIRKEVMLELKSFGIDSERAHNEVGAGQHEIGFKYDDPLTTADRVITLKRIIMEVAHRHGLIASFMPKPLFQKAGNGMHVHFSLFDEKGNPLFFDEKDPHHLSPLAKSFIAGQLAHVKEMVAILDPTVSSYKRLVAGYEAPVYICWGSRNRSSLVRIPRYTEGKKASARAELRCPDPSASPYLAFAAMLAAGLAGIDEGLELMPESEDSVFDMSKEELDSEGIDVLPGSLAEAVAHFKASRLMRELMGDEMFEKYADAKEKEAEAFRIAVTDWEIGKYLEAC